VVRSGTSHRVVWQSFASSQQGTSLVQYLRILTEVGLHAVDLLGFRFRHICW
jgi:hypothetical protein